MKLFYVALNSICLLLFLLLTSLVMMWGYFCGIKMFTHRDHAMRKEIAFDKDILSDFIFKSKIHLLYVKERVKKFNEMNEENLKNLEKSVQSLELNIEGVKGKNKTSCFKLFENQTCGEWMDQRLKMCAYLKPSYDKITWNYVQLKDKIIDPIFPRSKEILDQFEDFQNDFNKAIEIYKMKELKCEALFLHNSCTLRNDKWVYGQFKNITSQHTNLSAAISSINNVSIIFTKFVEMFETLMWHDFRHAADSYLTCLNKI
ncbi:uncharacterized protein LOC106670562 [Cimex lectularius]|uniref:Uncharacterized protein n=1 Tax=Cimex lectularius TaxID=79782 RepID=A0A8I6S468_CIMLE|nr:uncharacterized protein LOC106670562 [Cimex lectularius]